MGALQYRGCAAACRRGQPARPYNRGASLVRPARALYEQTPRPLRRRRRPRYRRALGAAGAGARAGRAPGRHAAGRLPGRSRLRRGRRLRRRRAEQPGERPHGRRLRGARGRQAAEGHVVLAREHSDRARRAAAVRHPADRGRRPDQRAPRGAHLSDRPRRPAHRVHPHAAREGGHAALLRAELRHQRPGGRRLHRPQQRLAGLHQQSAPADGGRRQVHRPEAADRRRSSGCRTCAPTRPPAGCSRATTAR